MAMTEQQIQLVVAAQKGDMKSFEQLYAIYYQKVYGFARMILRNEVDAEDVMEEAFITAWRKLGTLESPPAFSVWIQIIAKNLCNMQLRRKNIAILLDAEQEIEDFDTEDSETLLPAVYAERADLKERLGRIIDGLSDVQRQTVVLYYFNELSVDEISDVMECSPGTVKSRLFLARNTIRAEVEEQERKTGQKFYGLVGIPTLPLGQLVQSHVESLSIGQSAANASLGAITNTISGTSRMAAAESGAEMTAGHGTQTTGAGSIKTAGALSLKAKALIGIAIAAAAAVVVLVAVFSGGGGGIDTSDDGPAPGISADAPDEPDDASSSVETETPVPAGDSPDEPYGGPVGGYGDLPSAIADIPREEALGELYFLLNGYWITDGYPFVGFFTEGGAYMVEYGLFQTEFGARGEIVGGRATGTYEAELDIHIPAVPATEMSDGRPEMTETIHIDFTAISGGVNIIKVKIDDLDDGSWHEYEPGGATLEEAFNTWDV